MRDSVLEEFGEDGVARAALGQLGPAQWYRQVASREGFVADPAQLRAIERFQRLFDALVEFKAYRARPLSRAFGRRRPPRGLYVWGGVGRGKSFLMDAFFRLLPLRRKRRVHFHHFMREVHAELDKLRGQADPLAVIAHHIAVQNRLLCLDEFHVSDIVDAMILGRLLREMVQNGVVIVTTSNYRPEGLYPNGLQREKFLPAIALINHALDVLELDGEEDHRLRRLDRVEVYHSPLDETATANLRVAFRQLTGEEAESRTVSVLDRRIPALGAAAGVAWFAFAALCGDGRSQADYLELARERHTVLLSDIPCMGPGMAAEARRFTWLVDVFYDHGVKLLCSAEVFPEQLYVEGLNSAEFSRTVSRLKEMQSREYLGRAHLA